MGISLLDCIDPDIEKAAKKSTIRLWQRPKDLVAVEDEIAAELGIPIVNKRVSVLRFLLSEHCNGYDRLCTLAKALDRCGQRSWGQLYRWLLSSGSKGYQRGMKSSLILFLALLQRRILSALQSILDRLRQGSIWQQVRDMGRIIKEASEADQWGQETRSPALCCRR